MKKIPSIIFNVNIAKFHKKNFDLLKTNGVNNTAYGFSAKDWMTDNSYFNISDIKLSITSLYIISDAPKYDTIRTETLGRTTHTILVYS